MKKIYALVCISTFLLVIFLLGQLAAISIMGYDNPKMFFISIICFISCIFFLPVFGALSIDSDLTNNEKL